MMSRTMSIVDRYGVILWWTRSIFIIRWACLIQAINTLARRETATDLSGFIFSHQIKDLFGEITSIHFCAAYDGPRQPRSSRRAGA